MSALDFETRNDAVLAEMTPFVVALPNHVRHLDLCPFGMDIPPTSIIDPTRISSERFLHLLQTLDKLTFGPEGMPMPRWVFYNCAEIPGAIFGFGYRAEQLPAPVREALGVRADEPGLVPFSMYVAIPVSPPGVWFGHNLASLNPTFPALGLRGLASMTKAIGLKVFRCTTQVGATQWDSDALYIHTRFGALELATAWTPAHSTAATLTYHFEVTDQKLIRVCAGTRLEYPDSAFSVGAEDEEAMQALQVRIEAGERFAVGGPPTRNEHHGRLIPIVTPAD